MFSSATSYMSDPRINCFEREEKLKVSQAYKKKNQRHPAYRR